MVVSVMVFFAIVAAMSRLLEMRQIDDYIRNVAKGISNLFEGVFAQ
jgi:hypothetical protein